MTSVESWLPCQAGSRFSAALRMKTHFCYLNKNRFSVQKLHGQAPESSLTWEGSRGHSAWSVLCPPSSGLLCVQGLSSLVSTVCFWPSRPFWPFCPCPLISSSPYHVPRFQIPSINAQESRCLTGPVIFSCLACSGWGCVCRAAAVWGVPGLGEALHSRLHCT